MRLAPTRLIVICLAAFVAPAVAGAQPLADRLPADTVLYVGWAGADSLGPQYEGSHLKAVLEASNVPKLVDDFLPKLLDRVAKQEPQARDALGGVATLGRLWHKPCAFAFTGIDMANARTGPTPRAVFVCRAGEDAARLQRQFEGVLRQARVGEAPVPVKTLRVGDLVGIAVGYDKPESAIVSGAAQQTKSLAGSAAFKSAAGRVSAKDPAFIVYADAEAGVKLVNQAVEKSGDVQASEMWPRVREAAGLDGLKRVVWTEGFDGKEWGTRVFVEAPAPRRGLLALLESQPLGDEILKAVPATATIVGASRFDPLGFVEELRGAVGKVHEDGVAQMDAALDQASNMLGLDVRKEFLGALGDQWAYYTDPMIGGRGTLGLVVVNRLRDAANAEKALTKIQSTIESIVAQQTRNEKMTVSFRETSVNGVTVHYVATPFVSPGWSVHGGNLYVGLYPQVVAAAATHSSRGGKGLLDNKEFVALRQRLLSGASNNAGAASVQFMDLPKTAPSSYQMWLMVSSLARFGDMLGVESPDLLFPTMDVLMQHLSPAGSVSWADDTGWHLRGVSPFPGSVVFAADTGGMMGVQSTSMMVGVLLPALQRARGRAAELRAPAVLEADPGATSMGNLRQLAIGCLSYASDHQGALPATLSEVVPYVDKADVLLHPNSSARPPARLSNDDAKRWAAKNSSYVLLRPAKRLAAVRGTADTPLIHESFDLAVDGRIRVAFADGHCDEMTIEDLQKAIATTQGR